MHLIKKLMHPDWAQLIKCLAQILTPSFYKVITVFTSEVQDVCDGFAEDLDCLSTHTNYGHLWLAVAARWRDKSRQTSRDDTDSRYVTRHTQGRNSVTW